MRLGCVVCAYALLSASLYTAFTNAGEHVPPLLLLPVLGALLLSLAGASSLAGNRGLQRPAAATPHWWFIALGCVILLQIVGHLRTSPVMTQPAVRLSARSFDYLQLSAVGSAFFRPMWFPIGLLAIGLVALSYAWPSMPGRRLRFPVVLGIYVYLGAWVIYTTPRPYIDTWTSQQRACKLLLARQNPYAADYPNPYGSPQWFAPQVVRNDRIHAFQYPPLSLLLTVPGYLWGDVRWSMLAATAGAVLFAVAAGRRLGLPPGHPGELAVIALLCHPQAFLMIEMGWTEPFLALGLAIASWAILAQQRTWLTVALAGLLAVKQYGFWLVPAPARSGRLGWRAAVGSIALAAAITLPFFVWDPEAFWRSMVTFHLQSPFRMDHSLTVPGAIALWTGLQPSAPAAGYERIALLGFVAAAFVLWRVVRQPILNRSQALLGTAAVLLAFILFGKGGHPNYYWLVSACLALGMSAAAADGDSIQTETPP